MLSRWSAGGVLTKPDPGRGRMVLVEECRLRLEEPVDDLLPELADRSVLRRLDVPVDDTLPADRPAHLRDPLTLRPAAFAVASHG